MERSNKRPNLVIIYTTRTCPKCDDMVNHLNDWGVQHEERDLFNFSSALEDVLKRVGYTFHLPIVRLGSKVVVGHDINRVILMLQGAGYQINV